MLDPLRIFTSLVASLLGFGSSAAFGEILLSNGFETNPLASGWTRSGPGAVWTATGSAAGDHSLMANADAWAAPLWDTEPLHWYRLSFKSKAPGTVTNIGSIGYACWSAVFYDANGVLLNDDQYSSVFQSSDWVVNEFRIRAKHRVGPGGTLLPVRMKVSFHPIGNQPLYIDDVLIEETSIEEVTAWADSLYEGLARTTRLRPKVGSLAADSTDHAKAAQPGAFRTGRVEIVGNTIVFTFIAEKGKRYLVARTSAR